MTKTDARAAAVALRLAGRTYDEIAAELGISKSSCSLWLRDRPVPSDLQPAVQEEQADRDRDEARRLRADGLLLREVADQVGRSVRTVQQWTADLPVPERARHGGGREHMALMRRRRWDAVLARREAERREGKAAAAGIVGVLSERELELLAVTAYWCEGTKDKSYDRRERVIFINSDAGLVRLFLAYLDACGVVADRLRFSVSIHESADVDAATRHWAEVVGVPSSHFLRASLKRHNPSTSRKNTGDAYVGCLVVRVLDSRRLYQHVAGVWEGIVAGLRAPPEVRDVAG
jgi:transposase